MSSKKPADPTAQPESPQEPSKNAPQARPFVLDMLLGSRWPMARDPIQANSLADLDAALGKPGSASGKGPEGRG